MFIFSFQEVYIFLKSIKLEELAPIFANEAITMNVLEELDEEALEKIGILRLGNRRNITSNLKGKIR